jgi:hypothetical protein
MSTIEGQAGAIGWLSSFDEALQRARETDRFVLFDVFNPG